MPEAVFRHQGQTSNSGGQEQKVYYVIHSATSYTAAEKYCVFTLSNHKVLQYFPWSAEIAAPIGSQVVAHLPISVVDWIKNNIGECTPKIGTLVMFLS